MKIKGAILHQPVAVPGVMAPNIYINTGKVPGIRLKWDDAKGLVWSVKTKGGEPREGFFPSPTVSCVETENGHFWPEEGIKKKAT